MRATAIIAVAFGCTFGFIEGARAGDPKCQCASCKETNGWCEACAVGYVACVRLESRALYEAIDAHGHDVRPDSFRCASCKQAIQSDEFCSKCKIGFIRKQAYFSKLTYLLGRGKMTHADSIRCERCLAHVEEPGWCDECQVGMVGYSEYRDKELFAQAAAARKVLIQAIQAMQTCPSCAIAIAVDRACPLCKKSYEGGKVVPQQPIAPPTPRR